MDKKYIKRRERLLKVMRAIPNKEKTFDLRSWANMAAPEDQQNPNCGFHACIGGWYYTMVPQSRKSLLNMEILIAGVSNISYTRLKEYFGMSYVEGWYIFIPDSYPIEKLTSHKYALNRLVRFLKNGIVSKKYRKMCCDLDGVGCGYNEYLDSHI